MRFKEEYENFYKEMDTFYATYPIDISAITGEMNAKLDKNPPINSYLRKAITYETAAEKCGVKVFRHYPFYYEILSGRQRKRWGFDGIGGWHVALPQFDDLKNEWLHYIDEFRGNGLVSGPPFYDPDHHCVGYDNVLTLGLKGIIEKAEKRLQNTSTEKETHFLEAVIMANKSLAIIAENFSNEAARMIPTESDPYIRKRLERIHNTAKLVPYHPPETFYEALNTIIFMREAAASLEGLGISMFGHVDRMLIPYYKKDIDNGRITEEEAYDLVAAFLAYTDVKFDSKTEHHETSTTVVIGGCDNEGKLVFNDITKMVIRAYKEYNFVNPKLNIRLSQKTPKEFLDAIADLLQSGHNVCALFNDDVLIQANVKSGKVLEDARLYVGGGCQENILQNTEIHNRCSIYINMSKTLHMGLFPERTRSFNHLSDRSIEPLEQCFSFDDFYAAYLQNLKAVVHYFIARRNVSEALVYQYNPCPLLSSTLSDCIENAKDMMEGGCRYSYGAINFIGIGTLIDSLYAIKHLIFDKQMISFNDLKQMLIDNFEGHEEMMAYILNRIPKYGQDSDAIMSFSAKVFKDIAHLTEGERNARGGYYEPSVMTFRSNINLGSKTDATPDGRKKGAPLSVGMTPSFLSDSGTVPITGVFNTIKQIDLSDYPQVAILDFKFPLSSKSTSSHDAFVSVLKIFLTYGGSVLQPNLISQQTLIEAKQDPDKHPDLIVRVSGFSAYFNALGEGTQDEMIRRAEVQYAR